MISIISIGIENSWFSTLRILRLIRNCKRKSWRKKGSISS